MLALYRAGRQAEALEVVPGRTRPLHRRARDRARPRAQAAPGGDPSPRGGARGVRRAGAHGRGGGDRQGSALRSSRARHRPRRSGRPRGASRRAFAVPDDRPVDLARVSQYVATMQGSGPLYDELHARFEAAVEPGPLQRFLARLPALLRERGAPHQLIVTTNYDLALERAFEEAGEELDIVAYVATGTHRGRFWHRPPGEPPRPIDVPNTYATELDLDRRTILFKLHGAVDPLPEREWESFVITEDDYIDYLGHSELDRRRPGRARGQASPQPLPLPRLRDGRLEPAPDPQPDLGRAARRVPLVGGAACAEPARAGVLAAFRRRRARRRSARRTSSCSSGDWRRA